MTKRARKSLAEENADIVVTDGMTLDEYCFRATLLRGANETNGATADKAAQALATSQFGSLARVRLISSGKFSLYQVHFNQEETP